MNPFRLRYEKAENWYQKIILMEVFHLIQTSRNSRWTLNDTSETFKVSMGLVSENLKIARGFHTNPELLTCKNRQDALNKIEELND